MPFQVYESKTFTDLCDNIRTINVGSDSPGNGTPNKFYLVTKEEKQDLLVKVYYEYENPFCSYIIWQDFLFIGMLNNVCYVNLTNLEISTFHFDKNDLYFGHFYQYLDFLLIASSNGLYCMDKECNLLWKTDDIAIDGVVIHDLVDNLLSVSGEVDPPGGWVNYKIEITTGKIS